MVDCSGYIVVIWCLYGGDGRLRHAHDDTTIHDAPGDHYAGSCGGDVSLRRARDAPGMGPAEPGVRLMTHEQAAPHPKPTKRSAKATKHGL